MGRRLGLGRGLAPGRPHGGRRDGRWLAALEEPFEGAPFPALAAALPDGSTLWAGNSMPVRDMDGWLPSTERSITVRSNRGANGIDGVVSTALGSAATAGGPVALVVGDVSFLHDMNALVAAKLHGLSATIVLVNNDGGGIFSFLPQASAAIPGAGLPDRYEELFGTPHGIDVAPIVTALGGEHVLVGPDDLRAQVERSVGCAGVQVLELRTDRARTSRCTARSRRSSPRRSGRERAGRRRPPLGGPGARHRDAAAVDPRLHGSGDVVGLSCRRVRALVPGDRR